MNKLTMNECAKKRLTDTYLIVYAIKNEINIKKGEYIETTDVYELNTYTIEIYANKYSCAGERFRTIPLITPMYNPYSELAVCQNNSEFYYCQQFISSENISLGDFINQVEKYTEEKQEEQQQEENNKNFIDKLKDFYNNNKLIIYSVGIVIVVAGVATTVILIKKKRSRVL